MELLSPAGDMESLKLAVKCGADAVYVGGPYFSARKSAKNFTEDELKEAVDYCHLYGVKLYVALNILIKEAELDFAKEYANRLICMGADGIIVQDLGLLSYIRAASDSVQINASTQMTICSSSGVRLLSDLGVNRVVLARELTEQEIKSIRAQTDVELEVFVHGALCISWSGQCLMSSFIGGRSGNRGACAQPCRLPYTLLENGKAVTKPYPLLSTKDLCLAKEIDQVKAISDSAKIEGRMKSAEYTGSVTKVYKNALEDRASAREIADMLSFFSRGGSSLGYFHGISYQGMMDQGEAGKISASKESTQDIHQTDFTKKRPVSFTLYAKEGEPLCLKAETEGFSADANGKVCERANSGAFDKSRMEKQLKKLGDTPFVAENITIYESGVPFVSISELNGLRRTVSEELAQKICASYRRNIKQVPEQKTGKQNPKQEPILCVQVRTKEQYETAKNCGISEIYISANAEIADDTAVTVLPSVTKEGETKSKGARVLVQNLGQIYPAGDAVLYGGERLNITNSDSLNALKKLGFRRATLSTELNINEMRKLCKHAELATEIIAYGRLPVMLIENCIIKSAYRCVNGKGSVELLDRKGERFPVLCENCRNVILNSVPLYMADKLEDIISLQPEAIRLIFTVENAAECTQIIQAYQAAMQKETVKNPFDKITRGHFYRGVE